MEQRTTIARSERLGVACRGSHSEAAKQAGPQREGDIARDRLARGRSEITLYTEKSA